jgi:hypothetical protein
MSDVYMTFSFGKHIGEDDPISFEQFPADGLTEEKMAEYKADPTSIPNSGILERISDNKTIIYNINSVYDLYVSIPEEKKTEPTNPFTREIVPQIMIDRVKLYKEVFDKFGPDFKPNIKDLRIDFFKFLNNNPVEPDKMLLLKRFLKIDDIIDIFGEMFEVGPDDDRMIFRNRAISKLENTEDGKIDLYKS